MTLKCQMNRRDNRNCISYSKNPGDQDIIELVETPKLFVPVTDKKRPHSPTVDVVFKNQKQPKEDATDGVNWQGCR